MQWFRYIVTVALLLYCSNAATINRPEIPDTASLQTLNSLLPWNNSLISLFSYFATSTPSSYDISSDEDYYGDDCEQDKSPSSETIIIYDVEEQVLPSKNSTNGTNSVERFKRNAEETKELSDRSEARHKDVRPYPGYFLGRKLWYVPLWFGIYYSFYLLCLVVKSVARHRISYPALLPADTTLERKRARQKKHKKSDSAARRIADSIQMYSNRYRQYP